MATPFMALTLPTPGVTNDLTGEQQEVAAFNVIDGHDHTSGKGVQVPIAGLNINADLSLTTGSTNFNLTGARSVRLVNLSATPTASTDINELVDSGGNLYWMNSSGQAVQITAGAALSATSLGGISGLPSGTASAAFGSQTFTWRSATNTAATMDAGPVLIRDTALGASAITLQSPAGIGSPYTLTLPAALPGSNLPLSMSAGGALAAAQIVTAQIANAAVGSTQIAANGVARSNLVAVGQQLSSSCSTFTTASATLVDVTNLTVTITTTGRPVMLFMLSDGSGSSAQISATATSGGLVTFKRDTTEVARYFMQANTGDPRIPGIMFVDPVGAGTYTYKVQALAGGGGLSIAISFFKLLAFEL